MKIVKYLKDKFFEILLIVFFYLVLLMMLMVFRVSNTLIIAFSIVFWTMIVLIFLIDFLRKKKFYDEFLGNIEALDKKYLALETLTKPSFYEGEILWQGLYETHKSMIENVKDKIHEIDDFKDYIEMWIHEAKIPISSLTLLCHNHKDKINKTFLEQIKRLDNYIEQVLYYVRSNYTEEDFTIKRVFIDKVISGVLLKNKDDLLENKIDIEVNLEDGTIYTDQKWIDFILNQIINNSIKYKRDDVDSKIKISTTKEDDKIILSIWDNGIGIPEVDIENVCKKSFTGMNGRSMTKSTGMGLYIADKLCGKLGHRLEVFSKVNEYTEIRIIFGSHNFYKDME